MIDFSARLFAWMFFILCGSEIFAQQNCGTPAAPSYLLKEINADNSGRSVATYTIPVVFHIYYDENSAITPLGYEDVMAALDTLNMRFAKENSDTNLVYSGFKPLMADAQIRFELARKDESGNCISGIFYNYVNGQTIFNIGVPNLNTNKYLNIHVVNNTTGIGGTGTYPTPWSATPASNNQVIATADGIFSFLLAHEAGHWLSLIHTFGNTNNTGVCGDDQVSDTPITSGGVNCDTLQSVCNPPIIENVNNYMDYSECRVMFTQGQVSRMQGVLNDTTLSRREIWTPANLNFTGVNPTPVCSFSMALIAQSNDYSSCTFSSHVDFIANPLTVFPDSVKWIFPGGIPASSSSATESVFFPAIATVTVTLNAFYAGSTYTYTTSITPNNFTTTGLSLKINYPFTKDFENGTSLPDDDLYALPSDTTWQMAGVGYNSDSSIFVLKEHKLQTDTNKFISGVYNLEGLFHPELSFKVATSKNSSVIYRKLFVYLRNRCLNTERLVSIQYDSVLAGSNTASNFIPVSNAEWKNVNINLRIAKTETNFKEYELRFELVKYFKAGQVDENFFIDDINIKDTVPGGPPVANFSIENVHFCYAGCKQLEIVDQSTGSPFAYAWGGLAPSNPVLKGCYNIPPFDTFYIYLQVTNEFGSSSISKPIYIHNIWQDSLVVTPNPVCKGDTVGLHFYSSNAVENSETYLWTNTNTPTNPYSTLLDSAGAAVDAHPLNSVTYNVAVQNAYGCSASFNKPVTVNYKPVFDFGLDTSFCQGNTIVLNPFIFGANYLWNTGDFTQTLTVDTSGFYSLLVTMFSGCTGTDSINITTVVCTDIAETSDSDLFSLAYGSDNIFVTSKIAESFSIKMFDLEGRLVLNDRSAGNVYELKKENYAKGIYFLMCGDRLQQKIKIFID